MVVSIHGPAIKPLRIPRQPDGGTSMSGETIISDRMADDAFADPPDGNGPTVDVLALTDQERWQERIRFMHMDGGCFDLSGLKEYAGIGSHNTHITLDQLNALHHELSRIVEGLDRPASEGPKMSHLVGLAQYKAADLAAAAGVDGDALQRHLDGQGPLSQIAFRRVFDTLVGTKDEGRLWSR